MDETPLLVVVHSGIGKPHADAAKDKRWLERFTRLLTELHIPFWAQVEAGQSIRERFQEVLDGARVVVLLVSPDLMDRADLLDAVAERLRSSRGRNEVVVRPLLVRAGLFDGHPLLQTIKPINRQPLASLRTDAQERYLDETVRRVQELLKTAFRLEVKNLLNERPRDVAEHINRIVCLLNHAASYLEAALSDVADIAAYLLQELLGSGVSVPSKRDNPALIQSVLQQLCALCSDPKASSGLKDEAFNQIHTVIRCLQALRPGIPVDDIEPRAGREPSQWLLPFWVGAAERAVGDEERWMRACCESLFSLSDYFAERRPWMARGRRALPLARISHCLWFCAHVLKDFPPDAREVRTALAYVMREGLRFICFGFEDNEGQRRSYYYFDTTTYTSALRTLVAYHAGRMLGDPFGRIVSDFLRTVGSTTGVNHYLPAEHLQHILEIYMAGNFMLGVRLRGRDDDLTLAEALRGCRNDDRVLVECRRAFILAALFHDVGHLVLPRLRPPIPELGLELSTLERDLSELASGLSAPIHRFAEVCVDKLEAFAEEPEVKLWLEEQRKRPGHGLLSAWYLLDVCNAGPIDDWVRRSAVRAVLLHNALTVRLSADRDPIAALLVLCDEIFEWDPGQRPGPGSVGKSLQVIAPEVPSHEPRDRWIWVEHLRMDSELNASMKVGEAGAVWPTIHIQLQGPQRIAMPIYKLWFRKSQNLGRIVPAACGFGPAMVMTSAFPFHGDTNLATIEAFKPGLPGDLRSILESWLDAVCIRVTGGEETIHLRSFEDHPSLHAGLPRLLESLSRREKDAPSDEG